MATLAMTLQADPDEINRMRAELEAFAERQALPEDALFRLTLVLDELLTNAMDYAFAGIARPEIRLRIEVENNRLMACLRDNGRPFDPFREAPDPDLDAPLEQRRIGGLGLHFVRSMMARADYRREGEWNVVELKMRLDDTPA